jgi:hypothetical protein
LTGQTQNNEAPFEMTLHLKNFGIGPAFNIHIEYSIVGIKDSNITIIDPRTKKKQVDPDLPSGVTIVSDETFTPDEQGNF